MSRPKSSLPINENLIPGGKNCLKHKKPCFFLRFEDFGVMAGEDGSLTSLGDDLQSLNGWLRASYPSG